MKAIFSKLLYQMEKGKDCVLVTIVAASGSTPRAEGSQMLVGQFGRLCGSIGGGAIEKASEEYALMLLGEKRSDTREFGLHPGADRDIGMICGGDVTVLFTFVPGTDTGWQALVHAGMDAMEAGNAATLLLYADGRLPGILDRQGALLSGSESPDDRVKCYALPFRLPHRAIIFGAGHIARALCPVLKTLDFTPIIFDDRPEYAKPEFFPEAAQVLCGDFTDIAAGLTLLPDDFVVVMTSGHAHDYAVEKQVHGCDVAYLGIVGSRSKRASVCARLLAEGISEEKLNSVHTPVGIAIRAVTPEEIAISVAGEMILVRAGLGENGSAPRVCPV